MVEGGIGTPVLLEEIVRRVVAVADSEPIILFGSTAHGDATEDSDIDTLVVKGGIHRRRLARCIYGNLVGVGQTVDVIVATPDDLEQYTDTVQFFKRDGSSMNAREILRTKLRRDRAYGM